MAGDGSNSKTRQSNSMENISAGDISKETKEPSNEGVKKFWGKVRWMESDQLSQCNTVVIKSNVGKSHCHCGEQYRQKPPLLH